MFKNIIRSLFAVTGVILSGCQHNVASRQGTRDIVGKDYTPVHSSDPATPLRWVVDCNVVPPPGTINRIDIWVDTKGLERRSNSPDHRPDIDDSINLSERDGTSDGKLLRIQWVFSSSKPPLYDMFTTFQKADDGETFQILADDAAFSAAVEGLTKGYIIDLSPTHACDIRVVNIKVYYTPAPTPPVK